MKIGLVPGSFKPYHAGHDALVRLAAAENEGLLVFSSTADRTRKGELPLFGVDMQKVIDKFIRSELPKNVQIIDVGVPVSAVWDELKRAESEGSVDVYTVYSDSEDIKKFNDTSLSKYVPLLLKSGRVRVRGVQRGSETPDISGTKMRAYLAAGDIENFSKMLPPSVRKYDREIADLLLRKNESLIRSFIRSFLLS